MIFYVIYLELCRYRITLKSLIVHLTATTINIDENTCITKKYLYNFDPLKPHFYIVKLGLTGVYIIFLISA